MDGTKAVKSEDKFVLAGRISDEIGIDDGIVDHVCVSLVRCGCAAFECGYGVEDLLAVAAANNEVIVAVFEGNTERRCISEVDNTLCGVERLRASGFLRLLFTRLFLLLLAFWWLRGGIWGGFGGRRRLLWPALDEVYDGNGKNRDSRDHDSHNVYHQNGRLLLSGCRTYECV